MAASLQACGVVFPFAISTSICRSKFTICSGLYRFIGMTGLLQVNSLSFHLVQKSPVRSVGDTSTLCKLCEDQPELAVTEREFSGSLFQGLNDPGTTVNVLIGSK